MPKAKKDAYDSIEWTVDEATGCWNVHGVTTPQGYRPICRLVDGKRKTLYAHRLMFEKFIRPLQDGEVVCHRCDNPKCINPEHLWAGTDQDNARDAANKGRLAATLTRDQALEIITKREWHSGDMTEMSIRFNVSRQAIKRCKDGRTWFWLREQLGPEYTQAVADKYEQARQYHRESTKRRRAQKKPVEKTQKYREANREQARIQGKTKYEGRMCPIHGITERYTLTGRCAKCTTDDSKKHYESKRGNKTK